MQCLVPLTITSGMLTSSVPEVDTGETAWVSGTTYAVSDVRTYDKRKYERLIAGAGTTTPNLATGVWLDIGPTNKWAMFDTLRNTATVSTGTLTIAIAPIKRFTAIALMQLEATSVTMTLTVLGTPVMATRVYSTVQRHPVKWSEYFFGNFKYKPALAVFDLPPYSGAVITLTIANTTGSVSVGALCLGSPVYVGAAQYSAVSSALNFSTITRDTFGNVTLIPRRSVPKTDQVCEIDKGAVDSLVDLRRDINAVPCVWSCLDDLSTDGYFNAGLILGIYKEFSINLAHPYNALVTLQLEEV